MPMFLRERKSIIYTLNPETVLPMADSPQSSPKNSSSRRNFERPPWCYLLWGVPAALTVIANRAYEASLFSLTTTGILYTLSVLWIGTGCFINGRSCGRVHCRIDGILFPILGIAGVLNILSVFSFSWNVFWLVFFAILIASFVPEWTWKRYS